MVVNLSASPAGVWGDAAVARSIGGDRSGHRLVVSHADVVEDFPEHGMIASPGDTQEIVQILLGNVGGELVPHTGNAGFGRLQAGTDPHRWQLGDAGQRTGGQYELHGP